MRVKDEVNFELEPPLSQKLHLLDVAHAEAGIDREAVITSANDGKHMIGSLHYKKRAVDLRIKDLSEDKVTRLVQRLRFHFNGSETALRPFQVIVETAPLHIHLEYDPA